MSATIHTDEWAGTAGTPPHEQYGKWIMAWAMIEDRKYGAKAFVSEETIRRDPARLDVYRRKVRASVQRKLDEGASCSFSASS